MARLKAIDWVGDAGPIREDYSFVFQGYDYDDEGNIINQSAHLRRNRKNGNRYIKKKDRK